LIATFFYIFIKKIMTRFVTFLIILFAGVLSCPAQIPVSKEPRHHIVFENAWARVLDVRIPPGDTSLMHKHETPSVFIILSNTRTGSEVIMEPAKIQLTPGNIWFERFYTTARIHRVWNSDTSEFHAIDMELMNKNVKQIDSPLNIKSLALLFDEKPVRGYRFILDEHATVQIPVRKAPIVLFGLSNAAGYVTVNNKTFEKKGDFMFLPSGSAINFASISGVKQEFAFFELK
jgi:hypothetical protein